MAAACVLKISVSTLTETYLDTIERSRANSNGFEQLVRTLDIQNDEMV